MLPDPAVTSVCSVCQETFGSASRLKGHIASVHQQHVRVLNRDGTWKQLDREADGQFHCANCDTICSNPRAMQRHYRTRCLDDVSGEPQSSESDEATQTLADTHEDTKREGVDERAGYLNVG